MVDGRMVGYPKGKADRAVYSPPNKGLASGRLSKPDTVAGMEQPQSQSEWDERYSEKERIWSGNPNEMLVRYASRLEPPTAGRETAIDVGSGEGADAIWLAQNGWKTTGIDLSSVAVNRARESAAVQNLDVEFHVADVAQYARESGARYDLVTVFFLHSRDEEARAATMRSIPQLVAPDGQLLVVSHAAMPPWSRHHHHEDGSPRSAPNATAASEISALGLDANWNIEVAEEVERPATSPDGEEAALLDAVLLARRTN